MKQEQLEKKTITKYLWKKLGLSGGRNKHIRNKLKIQSGGVYVLLGKNDKVLYVGWTSGYSCRLCAHFSELNKWSKKIKKVWLIDYRQCDDIRKYHNDSIWDIEYYLIWLLNPTYNKVKAEHLIFENNKLKQNG
jgi:excinuclease UvrABC nuclease subunit